MGDFFYGNNRLVDDMETYGAGGFNIGLSGQDWLGLGAMVQGSSQGTELCGARPLFAGKSRDEWNKCNQNSLSLHQQQLGLQQIQTKSKEEIEKRKRITTIVIVSLVSVAVVTAVVFIWKRKKK